jgi:phage tail sheath gpL-like
MIFNKNFYSVLSLIALTFARENLAQDGIKLTSGSALSSGIVNPDALQELETNMTAYTAAANYGSASFNQVHPLYPGAVGL